MQFRDFRELTKNLPFFRSNILNQLNEDPKLLEVQLSQWVKKGYVIKLRRGVYTLSEKERSCKISLFQLANNIYPPSYVSLESALQYYNFIPERVFSITSVTSNKTEKYENSLGYFDYRSVKHSAFTGFERVQDMHGNKFFIATREKALLDFLFFSTKKFRKIDKNIFDLSFRFQNLEGVSIDKLLASAKIFQQKKILETAQLLAEYIQEEWSND